MGVVTTIKIKKSTKHSLDTFREHKHESYDEVIQKVLHVLKQLDTNPQLSHKALKEIQEARARVSQGIYVDEQEALERLGIREP